MLAARNEKGFVLGQSRVVPRDGSIDRRSDAGWLHTHVEPRVMKLLLVLGRHQGQVVSRSDLMRAVWGRDDVCPDTLNRCISELRHALGDDFRHPIYIETVPGEGYRLLARPAGLEAAAPERSQSKSGDAARGNPSESAVPDSSRRRRGGLFAELRERKVFRIAMAYAVMAWGLVQTMDVLWPHLPFPEWPLAMVVILAILGFPVAVVMAWVFEMTPEGVVVDMPVRESHVASAEMSRRSLDFVIIGALAIVVGVQGFLLLRDDPAQDQSEQLSITRGIDSVVSPASVAVLPFAELGDARAEGLGEGMASEIVTLLGAIDGLRVMSRTSSFTFRGATLPITEIGQQLGVATILEGSVGVENGVLHVNAQLVDARSQFNLWSQSYRRPLPEIFAIQSEITRAVMSKLDELAGIVRQPGSAISAPRPTSDVEAYRRFLQAEHLLPRRDRQLTLTSIELLENAVQMDGGFARAHASLARAKMLAGFYGWLPRAEAESAAEQSAEFAIGLDPELAEPYAVLASLRGQRGEFARAERSFRDALARDRKSVLAQHWFAVFLLEHGRLHEALLHARQAYELDPVSPVINGTLAFAHLALNDLGQAAAFWKRAGELGLQTSNYLLGTELELTQQGHGELVARRWREYLEARGAEAATSSVLLADLVAGGASEDGGVVGRVQLQRSGLDPASIVLALVLQGSDEQALEAFGALVREQRGAATTGWLPVYSGVRRLPGFADVMREAGYLEYWQSSSLPDMCENVGDRLVCR